MSITKKIGSLLGKLLKSNFRLVSNNIKQAFPEKDDEWVNRTAKESFRNLGRFISYFIQTPRINHKFQRKNTIIDDTSPSLKECFDKGGILITGHLGSWEWLAPILTVISNNQANGYAKKLSNPWVNKWVLRSRSKTGVNIHYIDGNHKDVIRAIRRKEAFGIIADQAAGGEGDGLAIPFMNRIASTFQGPARLYRITRCPVYFYWSYHDEAGKLHFQAKELEIPDIDIKKDPQLFDKVFSYRWSKMLEEQIRNHPADYFWQHNRWKKRFTEETEQQAIKFWQEYEAEKLTKN